MLGRLRLLLSMDGGHIGDMNVHKVHAPGLMAELSQGLDERHALDITDCTTQLDDTNVGFLAGSVDGDFRNSLDPVPDSVRYVRDTGKVRKTRTRRLRSGHLGTGENHFIVVAGDTYIWTVFPR